MLKPKHIAIGLPVSTLFWQTPLATCFFVDFRFLVFLNLDVRRRRRKGASDNVGANIIEILYHENIWVSTAHWNSYQVGYRSSRGEPATLHSLGYRWCIPVCGVKCVIYVGLKTDQA